MFSFSSSAYQVHRIPEGIFLSTFVCLSKQLFFGKVSVEKTKKYISNKKQGNRKDKVVLVKSKRTKMPRSRPASPSPFTSRSGEDVGVKGGKRPKSAMGFRTEERAHDGKDAFKSTKSSSDNDAIQVLVRVRPPNDRELHADNWKRSVKVADGRTCQLIDSREERKAEPYTFTFDTCFKETTTQEEIFKVAGVPIIKNVLDGYNSTIFAYGQTGAGKTHTMMGETHKKNGVRSENMGLAPRVLEYLFEKINNEEQQENAKKNDEELTFTVRCSFIELYNETITDLLHPASVNLPVRDDKAKGPYVDGLREVVVRNAEQAVSHMVKGIENRTVAETKMNKQSSRSHCMYTCRVERVTKSVDGSIQVRHSRLNLVDLAGSERNRSSGVVGEQLREAIHINKSLTTLGRVIRELIDAQKTGNGHIPYRDSRLTHLLQESLGGNAKTTIIANISPSAICAVETLSTLQFVKNAKNIKNKARVNEDLEKEMKMCEALQKQILKLKEENEALRNGAAAQEEIEELKAKLEEELAQANAAQEKIEDLKATIEAEHKRSEKLQAQLDATIENNATLRAEATSIKEQNDALQNERDALENTLKQLNFQVNEVHETCLIADEKAREVASTEREKLLHEQEINRKKNREAVTDLQSTLTNMGTQLIALRDREHDMLNELEAARNVMEDQQEQLKKLSEELCTTQHEKDQKQATMRSIKEQLAQEKDASAGMEEALDRTRAELSSLKADIAKKEEEIAVLGERDAGRTKSNDELQQQLDEATKRIVAVTDMKCQLENINEDLREQLEEVRKRHRESIDTVNRLEDEVDYMNRVYADACNKLEQEACYNDQLLADREQLNRAAFIFGNVVDNISDSIHESEVARSPSIAHKIREYDERKGVGGGGCDMASRKWMPRGMSNYDMFLHQGNGRVPSNGYGMESSEFLL